MKGTSESTGLHHWMLRVLDECDNVAAHFSADPVHDLRVSLRRCRSLADGMMAMDPERNWKAMKKAGKKLFQSLGALRDVQIMMEWIEKLNPAQARSPLTPAPQMTSEGRTPAESMPVEDPRAMLLHILQGREIEQKHIARAALDEFDRKQWRHWAKTLPGRAMRIRPGSVVFKHLALERWTTARDLHARALRNRSQVAFHQLRIGIKRFRYIVENFLPQEHQLWSDDLKHMQDLLGEVHDLDVLWATALSCHIFPDEVVRDAWHAEILEQREKRIDEYRARTTGPESLWNVWRAGLPQGKQIQQIAIRRMKLWAKALDPDFRHSERVARLAVELYDILLGGGLLGSIAVNSAGPDDRASLYAAALFHDVGKSKGNKGHHKQSSALIQQHGAPLGWKPEDLTRAALVARFHCGTLPTRRHRELRGLLPEQRRTIIRLAAILRVANAMDAEHNGRVRRLRVENLPAQAKHRSNGFLQKPLALGKNEALVIGAEGYVEGSRTARAVAAERYLLETVLRRPVIVKAVPVFRHPASGLPRHSR